MKKQWIWIGLGIGLVALIAVAGVFYQRLTAQMQMDSLVVQSAEASETAQPEATEEPRMLAPDFTVEDQDGNQVALSDFRGKPVILNFWASWCGPCKSEMPDFDTAWKAHGDEIQFLMVNLTDGVQETKEDADALMQQLGYSFPVYYDVRSEGAIAYGVMSIPVTYLIDAEGYLVAQGRGALDAKTLEMAVQMLLS